MLHFVSSRWHHLHAFQFAYNRGVQPFATAGRITFIFMKYGRQ